MSAPLSLTEMSYMGTTSPDSPASVNLMTEALWGHPTHRHQTGIAVSWKWVNGISLKRPNRFLPLDQVVPFAQAVTNSLVILHINFNPAEEGLPPLMDFLLDVWGRFGHVVHGMQMNVVPWPSPYGMELFYDRIGGRPPRMILQVSPEMEDLQSPKILLHRLSSFASNYTDVLLDISRGEGKPLDEVTVAGFGNIIEELASRLPNLRLGVAGGLGPDNVHLIEPLVRLYPLLNVDAEGNLRDKATDTFLVDRGIAFVQATAELLRSAAL